MNEPTLLGYVEAVSGSTVTVRQFDGTASGIAIISGRSYAVGQVGSFIRIPQGYHDLYGIISEVGIESILDNVVNQSNKYKRWLRIQLVGEVLERIFERGISQYPTINDKVHFVVEEDLACIYGATNEGQVTIGRLSNSESIPAQIDLNKLVTRHSAVLGSTGSGKSTTVTSLLNSITSRESSGAGYSNARVILIDIHGEYGSSFGDNAKVFKVNPKNGENNLYIPYWALNLNSLLLFLLGNTDEKALTAINEHILHAKIQAAKEKNYLGVDVSSLTPEAPISFCLKSLWFKLIDPEIKTWEDKEEKKPALEREGNAENLTAPVYKPNSPLNSAPYINKTNVLSIRRQLAQMRSRLLDRRYDFMLHPGPWEPNLENISQNDLPELLENWIGHERPITILDLSDVPSSTLNYVIGGILNIVCDALFWGRELAEGGRERPLLVVMEEAHRYLGKNDTNLAREYVQRIVKEGRKFGLGAMIVSQRPSEIDDTILSQCGTFFSLRLSNAADRAKVQAALPDSLSSLVESLPILRTGEVIISGEAAKLPIRCRIALPEEHRRPRGTDPDVSSCWNKQRSSEGYSQVVASWRSQNPKWKDT